MRRFATARITLIPMLFWAFTSTSHAQISAELAQKAPDASTIAATAEQQGHVRIIVQFSGPDQPMRDAASLASVKAQIASIQDAIVASHFGSATNPTPGAGFQRGLLQFDITPMFAVNVSKSELDALAADPRVTVINLDRLDPPTLIQSVPLVGMTTAYGLGATGVGQAVAVIDTGVQSNHEFLAGKVVVEACFSNAAGGGSGVTLCPNGQTSQSGAGAADPTTAQCINSSTNLCIHGTHVAGIAAGNNTNPGGGKPANGVAKSADIVAVQVFTRFNDTTSCGGTAPCVLAYTSDQISALNWLLQNALTPAAGVSLASVNMSLGGGQFTSACDTDSRKPGIDNLRSVGVATAIAAGNSGYTNAVSAPGCISTAVTVGSTDKQDVISSFSNMSSLVAVMAPGGFGGGTCQFGANNPDILSSVAGTSSSSNAAYECLAGTSMATPHVAGAFAAIRSACHAATIDSNSDRTAEHRHIDHRHPLGRYGHQAPHPRRSRLATVGLPLEGRHPRLQRRQQKRHPLARQHRQHGDLADERPRRSDRPAVSARSLPTGPSPLSAISTATGSTTCFGTTLAPEWCRSG